MYEEVRYDKHKNDKSTELDTDQLALEKEVKILNPARSPFKHGSECNGSFK